MQHCLGFSPRTRQRDARCNPRSIFSLPLIRESIPSWQTLQPERGRSGRSDCSFPCSIVHLTHDSGAPWQMKHHFLEGQGESGSRCFLSFPPPRRGAVKMQPGPVLNQPQMLHVFLPGGAKSTSSATKLRGAGRGPSDRQDAAFARHPVC